MNFIRISLVIDILTANVERRFTVVLQEIYGRFTDLLPLTNLENVLATKSLDKLLQLIS